MGSSDVLTGLNRVNITGSGVNITTSWFTVYSAGTYNNSDAGQQQADEYFFASGVFVRYCNACAPSHRAIFYQRISPIQQFSAYLSMTYFWSKARARASPAGCARPGARARARATAC